MSLPQTSTSPLSNDIEMGNIKDLSSSFLEEEVHIQQGKTYGDYKIGGMLAAFLSLISYTGSNYIAGTQTGDIYAGKIANSLSLGMFGIIYTIIMLRKGDTNFWKSIEAVTNIFGKKQELDSEYEKEVQKALAVSMIWGFLNAAGMTSLYIAFNNAAMHSLNISICVAILSGNCLFALIASFFVFNDQITIFQTLGVFINLGGVLIISLGQFEGGVTIVMVICSLIASSWLGIRIILSRYWTDRIESQVFIMTNFIAELVFGITWILISYLGYFELQIEISAQMIVFLGGILAASAEIFLFMGIERGVAGAVVSIAGTNTIAVGLLNWLFQGVAPSYIQVLAISLTTTGIIIMSLGDILRNFLRKKFSTIF